MASAQAKVGTVAEAERLRAKYSRGIQRIRSQELGVSPLNRSISPKYVHSRWYRILRQEGFSRFRYKHATAIEPNPVDPLSATKRTNEEATLAGPLLATVPTGQALFALMAKNHLCLGLHALLSGKIAWDDNPNVIMTQSSAELADEA